MSDDIVTRLRNLQLSSNQLWEIDVCKAMDEAADEIERLREELEAAYSSISGFIQMLGKFNG